MKKFSKRQRGYRSRREAVCLTLTLFLYLSLISVVHVLFPEQFWNMRHSLLLYGTTALVYASIVAWWQYFGRDRFPLPPGADQGPYVPKRLRELVEQSNDAQHSPE